MKVLYRQFILIGLLLPLTACSMLFDTYGVVKVSRPLVFTRERLVNERLREQYWLESKLKEPFRHEFQGMIDQRSFAGLYAKMQANFDPLGGRLNDAILRQQTNAIKQERSLSNLDHQIRTLHAQAQIDKISEEMKTKTFDPSYTEPPRQPSAEIPGVSKTLLDEELRKRDEEIKQLSDNIKQLEGGAIKGDEFRVPDPSEAEETRAKLTALERLNDEKAFRDAVISLMREKQLDDTHDLFGWTLYDLKFDISLIPGQNTSDYAEIDLQIAKAEELFTDYADFRLAYAEWLRVLQDEISQEAISQQIRASNNGVTLEKLSGWLFNLDQYEKVLERRMTRIRDVRLRDSPLNERQNELYMKAIADLEERREGIKEKCRDPLLNFPKQGEQIENWNYSIACAVQAKYIVALSSDWGGLMVDIHDPVPTISPDGKFYFSTIGEINPEIQLRSDNPHQQSDPDGRFLFLAKVRDVKNQRSLLTSAVTTGGMEPYVASIEPKEYVQNISDVAAREQLTNMVLALSASLPNGIGGEAYSQYVERSQEFLHAIQRQPLAIAFNSPHNNKFGWILGPRFTILKSALPYGKSAVAFRHSPIRHSFAVSVGLPSYQGFLCLNGSYSWINEKGVKSAGPFELWHNPQLAPICPKNSVYVPLARNMRGLTKAFLTLNGQKSETRSPQIHPISQPNKGNLFFLENGKSNQALLIRGKDLWRNPQVFVGSVKATNVEVLPDMEGILAHFGTGSFLMQGGEDNGKLDLTVVTSGGMDTIRKAIQIGKGIARSPRGLVMSQFAIKGEPLSIRIFDMPQNFHSLKASARPKDSRTFYPINTDFNKNGEEFKLSLNIDDSSWGTKVQELVLKIEYKGSPQDDSIDITQEGKPFVYFPSKEKSQPSLKTNQIEVTRKLTSKSVEIKQSELLLEIPPDDLPLFYKAYPGLQSALGSGTARLRFRSKGRDFIEPLLLTKHENFLSIDCNKLKEPLRVGKVEAGSHFLALDIEYSSSEIPLTINGSLAVTIADLS